MLGNATPTTFRKSSSTPSTSSMHTTTLPHSYTLRSTTRLSGIPPIASQAEPGLVGFRNLGNTCYMNASLQCLLRRSRFRSLLQHTDSRSLIGSLRDLTVQMSTSRTIVSPTSLQDLLGPPWSGREQQDAVEFILFLIDGLDTELSRLGLQLTHSKSDAPSYSAISSMFTLTTNSIITCLGCKTKTKMAEKFIVLPLTVPEAPSTLERCIEDFLSTERFSGSFACEKCRTHTDAVKNLEISSLPDILLIALKRFRWTGKRPSKNTTMISCNHNLVIEEKSYRLVGTIQHRGNTVDSGHYTAHIRHHREWFRINDEVVQEIGSDEVVEGNTYVLVFSRVYPGSR